MLNEKIFNQVLETARNHSGSEDTLSLKEFYTRLLNPAIYHLYQLEIKKVSKHFMRWIEDTILLSLLSKSGE